MRQLPFCRWASFDRFWLMLTRIDMIPNSTGYGVFRHMADAAWLQGWACANQGLSMAPRLLALRVCLEFVRELWDTNAVFRTGGSWQMPI